MSNEVKAEALFAGRGGFCLGFERASINTVWAIENDSRCRFYLHAQH